MTDIEAKRLRMHDAVWVETDGKRRPDTVMSTQHVPATEGYPEGHMEVETRLNGWRNAEDIHHRPSDEVPGEPPKPPTPAVS